MPNVYLLIDIFVVVALLVLGLAVVLRNNATRLNRVFAIFVSCVAVWIIANYISSDLNNSPRVATIANYFVFCFSFGAAVYLLQFAIALSEDATARRVYTMMRPLLFIVAAISFTPLVGAGVSLQGNVYAVVFGPLSWLYFATLVAVAAWIPYLLFRNIKRSKGEQRRRLEAIFISLCLALPFLVLTEAILPALTGWFGLTNIGILPMLILVAGLYYSVARHRLFNLRLVIVRSLAYAGTLGIIVVSYGLVSYLVSNFVTRVHSALLQGTLQTLLIIVVIITYRPLKSVFDRITNSLFYRDAYDPRVLIDELNQALVSNIELKKMLESASEVIRQNLKAQHCRIMIRSQTTGAVRIEGTIQLNVPKADQDKLREATRQMGANVVLSDELPQSGSTLKALMNRLDVVMVAPIVPDLSASSGNLLEGYVLLSQKQSGNMYTLQDKQVLSTIAKELLIAVQNALRFEEIQHFNITLQEEIEAATRKLQRQNKRLEELDNIKDDFISMASHQLRTPLTSVKGYLSMVLEGDAGNINQQQSKMLGQAFTSAQRMVFLITDLLNVSRLKTGKFIIDAVPVNLSSIIQEEVEQLRETAAVKSIKLSYKKPANFPELMLDEVKIRQVIMNFMDNAIYYTPTGGHIKVELIDKPSIIELRVVDDGIGVPRSEQHHLFTKFYRATNARKTRPDGTGLGLFMAAKVIAAQGGSIIFSSREGKGSTFGFALSKSRLRVPATPHLDQEQPETKTQARPLQPTR